MHRCGRCLSGSYCSQACADNNWDKHREECVEFKDGCKVRKAADSKITKSFKHAGSKDLDDSDTKRKIFVEKKESARSLFTNSLDEVD